jgi:hypothetical protein
MHDPDQPLGCFQKMSYGLLGLGLYLFCSFFSCCGLWLLTIQIYVVPQTAPNGLPAELEEWALLSAPPLSFIVIGPFIVMMYVLYLRDMRVIQVKDHTATPIEKEKRKKDIL